MRLRMRIAAHGLGVVSLALGASGCTILGGAIGSRADERNRRVTHGPVESVYTVQRGHGIALVLASGDTLRGEYRGHRVVDAGEYAARHARWLERDPLALEAPKPGDTVHVRTGTGPPRAVVFRGFTPGGIRVGPHPEASEPLAWGMFWAMQREDGTIYPIARLRDAERAGALPSDLDISVAARDGVQEVPANEVRQIELAGRRTKHWVKGMLIGAAIDGALVATAAAIGESMRFGPEW